MRPDEPVIAILTMCYAPFAMSTDYKAVLAKLSQNIAQIEFADLARAKQLQLEGAASIRLEDDFSSISTIAGLDVGFDNHANAAIGGIVVLALPDFTVIEQHTARRPVIFPYQPGFLSFREVPVLLDAYATLATMPDLLICDGQGFAPPRRFGLACHLGMLLDIPAIGAAKSRLIGKYKEPGQAKGSFSALMDKNEHIGAVLRTRDGTHPLFVSPGHKISHTSAIHWTLRCCPKYRLPETTRHAHKLVSR